MKTIEVKVNPGREVAQISHDFTHPVEVVREALHNSFDAGALNVEVSAYVQTLPDKRRVLSLDIFDDGCGMTESNLSAFFGLGFTEKPSVSGRSKIGYKGHGTKIYYQAQDVFLVTKTEAGPLLCAEVTRARESVAGERTPEPRLYVEGEAAEQIRARNLREPPGHGAFLRLVDYTPDSGRLIESFNTNALENYVRWFTVFGSFERVVRPSSAPPPLRLRVRGTDMGDRDVAFGHRWPERDRLSLTDLKKLDDRRPFNYFSKTFPFPSLTLEGGYRVDAAVLFEGRRARLDRDLGISRQRSGGLYSEEERYGVWLCRDFIPIEFKPEWLLDESCPRLFPDLRAPLIFLNSQDLSLIANRGSVGNSAPQLLAALKAAVYKLLEECQEDKDVIRFLTEYQEDLFSRAREKDKKALQRRVDRYNQKQRLTITLSGGGNHEFWEPKQEITLFGVICELQLLDPAILSFEMLDYDDYCGIDLLVRRNGTGELLDKQKVAYVELKYELQAQVNHAFDHLYGIVCWDTAVRPNEPVSDATGMQCIYQESKDAAGVTHSHLVPMPGSSLSHNVRVVVLKRLLHEKYGLKAVPNPRPIKK